MRPSPELPESGRPRNSQLFYAEALRAALPSARQWLDLGCGHQFLPEWLPAHLQNAAVSSCQTVGVDADADALRAHPDLQLRIVANVERLPLASASFDLVTANMVVEHVADPAALFAEVNRVLRPGGSFLIHTPNREGYTTRLAQCIPGALRPKVARWLQGREERDVYPTFYRANTPEELRSAAASAGLSEVLLATIESSPQLYRLPVISAIEEQFLLRLRNERLARWRPCILARFVRQEGLT